MGIYRASTPDGNLYAEFVAEHSYKLYFNGEAPSFWYYKIEGDTIILNGVSSTISHRDKYAGQSITYAFTNDGPGRITSRTSFTITAEAGFVAEEKVKCEFKKL